MNSFITNKKIVIKIGSNLINATAIEKFAESISELHKAGNDIIIVTSGAIALGCEKLGLKKRPNELSNKQACAALGQGLLMKYYEESFAKYNITVGQVLLTRQDLSDREKYINARNTVFSLFKYRAIPIINENDTVAVEEIKFGDNDTLAGIVSSKIQADYLIIFTDVDGLYTDDPNKNKNAKLLEVVEEISCEIEKIAKKTKGSGVSTGGMFTKVQSAKIATASGVEVIIANGKKDYSFIDIINRNVSSTHFLPKKIKLGGKKRWIFSAKIPAGKLFIDEGAEKAILINCKSLLPSGIIDIQGKFDSGDVVSVISKEREIARGITNYSSQDLIKIKGHKSSEISKLLGKCKSDEVVHRDNIVIL